MKPKRDPASVFNNYFWHNRHTDTLQPTWPYKYKKVAPLPKTAAEAAITRNTIREWYKDGKTVAELRKYFLY